MWRWHYLIRSSSQGGGNGVTVFVLQGRIPWTLPVGIQHSLRGGGDVSHLRQAGFQEGL
jgi:hypothetical protein